MGNYFSTFKNKDINKIYRILCIGDSLTEGYYDYG